MAACTRGEFAGVLGAGRAAGDTITLPAGTTIGKLKAGTVIIQQGRGNVANATDNRKAGQKGGAAATAPNATASATTKQGSLPWWVFAGVGVLSIVAWEWLIARFKFAAWLPWQRRPG
ncbi:hypothetical protein [Hymenobacter agri]